MHGLAGLIAELETASEFKQILQLTAQIAGVLSGKGSRSQLTEPPHSRPTPPKTASTRQKANNQAIELLADIQAKGLNRDELNKEQLDTLASYTGNGGGLTGKDGKRGSAYEYYTPQEIATSMWDLAKELGFNGGKVLDPSAGTGIFTATSPDNAVIDSIELDETSGGIAKILNDGKRSHTTIAPFESQAGRIEDDSLDMVITNVPFGDNKARGANKLLDTAYRNDSLENYFILRSLEKVKPNGLAIFITPTSVVSGKKKANERLRTIASLKAEFLGAYRLPNSVFEQTGADVVTDVVVFKRHNREALDMIDELYQSGDMVALADTKVLWQEFIDGQYFKQTGKRFILGETQQVEDKRWGGLKEQVVNTKPTAEVAKMMKKFGDSRIDWQTLNTSEPAEITYQNGDTVFQNGKQLVYQNGSFVEIEQEKPNDDMRDFLELIANMNSGAVSILEHGISYKQANEAKEYAEQTGQKNLLDDDVLLWLRQAQYSGKDSVAWHTITLAKAIEQTISEHGYGYKYSEYELAITKAMKNTYLDGKNTKLTGEVGQAHKLIKLHYVNGEYSKVWRGDVDTDIADTDSNLAKIQYENGSLFISREQFDALNPDVDPMVSDDWFVNASGGVIHADDYLVGSLKNRLHDLNKQIEQADDEVVKHKLIKQKMVARERAYRVDLQKIEFDLRTPLIDAETKVNFLRQHVHQGAVVIYDEYGKSIPNIKTPGGSNKHDTEKLYDRFGYWLQKGTVTLGNINIDMNDREALNWLSDKINRANTIFNTWVKANDVLISQLEAKINNEDNLYFPQNSDESQIDIKGMNPKLSLHGYQNAFVRSQGRSFGGINGFSVGLGKTFSALASVQHVQNIGVKQKTLFVVPNSVLSNWRKESKFAYTDTKDCIFIGLREQKDDKFKVYSNKYDEDLLEAVSKQYRKIFVTFEAFRRIRLKEATIEEYAEYLRNNDKALSQKELKSKDEKTKGMVAELIKTIQIKSNAPYLEDMGIDSIVVDEAHAFKNSVSAYETDSDIKYLSLAKTSIRGEDAQAKLWYVRGITGENDGIQLLTATPITNSPLEIYSMLSLAKGRDMVNAMACGIDGADDFIAIMCRVGEEVVPKVDGGEKSQNVFQSLRNLSVLRNTINSTATIKNAKDVGLSVVIPEREEVQTSVKLPTAILDDIKLHQEAYRQARAIEKEKPTARQFLANPNSAFNVIQERYGERGSLIAHPFNLIRKMDILISDHEFSGMASWYDFDKAQHSIAKKVVEAYNKKRVRESRSRMGAYTTEDRVKATYNNDGDIKSYQITTMAKIVTDNGRERIVIDTMSHKNQQVFEALAEKQGLKLNITLSPKLSAMLENFKAEMTNPRGVHSDGSRSNIVKQIIFCDHLHLHSKIKRMFTEKGGVKAGKIAIITGQTNNEPESMIDIQDGFNAFGDDNQYQVIIANKKAEVGINLQRGTQAIHHLTTGWTPDSLEQRNGRGARQGNMTGSVHIYQYDADGTFDEFKRTMIDKKGDWIDSVLSPTGKDNVAISGGLSNREKEALIETMGDKQAIAQYMAEKDEKERIERENLAKRRQAISLELIKTQASKLRQAKVSDFYLVEMKSAVKAIRDNIKNRNNMNKEGRKPHLIEKDTQKYNAQKQVAVELIEHIISSVELVKTNGLGHNRKVTERLAIDKTAEAIYQSIEDNAKDFKPSDENYGGWERNFVNSIGGDWSHKIEVIADSDYHADYDEVMNTAKNLIKQSVKSINDVADEIDTDKLPDKAWEKIVNGEAVVNHNGVYIEVGTIIIKNDEVGIVTARLEGVKLSDSGHINGFSATQDSQLITSNSNRYLDYVKLLAKAEDELYANNALKTPVYSDTIAQVAEYRDDSIKPTYKVSRYSHYKFSNAKLPILLPLGIFKEKDTVFTKTISKAYIDSSITIDFSNNAFVCDKQIEVSDSYFHDSYVEEVIIELVKGDSIKLSSTDIGRVDAAIHKDNGNTIAAKLIDVPTKEDCITHLNNFVESIGNLDEDSFSKDIDEAIEVFYRDFSHSEYLPDDLDLVKIKQCVRRVFVEYSLIDRYSRVELAYQNMIDEAKTKLGMQTKINGEYSDGDLIEVGGDTYEWKDKIKSYGQKYGKKFEATAYRKKRKVYYQWSSAMECWIVFYGAYRQLIEDHPRAASELTIDKAA